ncbi:hypothetical protein [Kitasatospora sp. NPDC056789]|uniref:hypothetical protein n=1 Tax=Kitasatospora sp. NPDC056789 TaxID=3345945 RepID=UPI00368D0CD1
MTQHGRALAIVTNYGVEQDELLVPVRHLRENGVHVDIAAPTRADEPLVTDDALLRRPRLAQPGQRRTGPGSRSRTSV